ncbi:hypothetical protein RBB79_16035 [Tunturiibacter empetritectus]|uniref:Uncharacterized protein n=1 Tax=Tunturiibacter lichenicola TaxID=2051959 RepID=A0A852VJ04_9BACT|nr:hypothetical protein [Edaphobacter lichenicola]NYF91129.1 hypothetical protein [Edaphobacter lichenicola]
MLIHQFGGSILVITGSSAKAAAVEKSKRDPSTVDRTARRTLSEQLRIDMVNNGATFRRRYFRLKIAVVWGAR